MDTSTPEGRDQFKAEWDALAEMAPELISKDDILYPHEVQEQVSQEPHFQRLWQHYREHIMKTRFAVLIEEGEIS
jgi:hypothetical protein